MNTKNISASELKTSEFSQVRGPDLDPICLTLRWYFEKVDVEKNRQATKKGAKNRATETWWGTGIYDANQSTDQTAWKFRRCLIVTESDPFLFTLCMLGNFS